jgi:predicted nucleic acid-binding protein
MEKAGRTLVRLDRFFQELVPKPCAEAHSQLVLEQAQLAAEYSNMCRRNGIQGSNTDFLICAVAIRNNFEIFTMDDDFNQYKKYIPIKLLDIKTIGRFV